MVRVHLWRMTMQTVQIRVSTAAENDELMASED
jgi:hypothetical protein